MLDIEESGFSEIPKVGIIGMTAICILKQECIPVGCVPTTTVAAGGVSVHGVIVQGVSVGVLLTY